MPNNNLNLYVSPNGNDAWSDSLPEPNAVRADGPLASLARAREIARGLQQVGGVTVTVSGGEYRLAPLPEALRVSDLQPGAGKLETLDRLPPPQALRWQRAAVGPSGYLDAHEALAAAGETDGALYFGCCVRCAEPMRVAVLLGYDGPVKLFVDGVSAFHDPSGTNPARPDAAAPEVALDRGDHELTVALGANRGLACGIFLRLRRMDLEAGTDWLRGLVLPEILATCKDGGWQ